MTERDHVLLELICTRATKTMSRTENMSLSQFLEDEIIQDSVLTRIQQVGELAHRVSASCAREHPEIPWKTMYATRNVLIHEYEGIDWTLVYFIVKDNLPEIVSLLRAILRTEEKGLLKNLLSK